MTRVVGILGGMGPAAGAEFARLFVEACASEQRALGQAVADQGFPEHWLAQVPVADRTMALGGSDEGAGSPLAGMALALDRLAMLGCEAVAIACNTAHAWHATLAAMHPGIELLHVAQVVAARLTQEGHASAVLLATQGCYGARVYEQAFDAAGIRLHQPDAAARALLMHGIYAGVKAGDLPLARTAFLQVARHMQQAVGESVMVMGCTEIPLALNDAPSPADVDAQSPGLQWLDASKLLAQALATRAYRRVSGTSRAAMPA